MVKSAEEMKSKEEKATDMVVREATAEGEEVKAMGAKKIQVKKKEATEPEAPEEEEQEHPKFKLHLSDWVDPSTTVFAYKHSPDWFSQKFEVSVWLLIFKSFDLRECKTRNAAVSASASVYRRKRKRMTQDAT